MYGYSQESPVGNGAVILTYPDPPINVSEVVKARSATSISLTWANGLTDGGAPVLDYRITFDQSSGDFIVLASNLNKALFTATGLNSGKVYKFKVESRNIYGYSAFSQVI